MLSILKNKCKKLKEIKKKEYKKKLKRKNKLYLRLKNKKDIKRDVWSVAQDNMYLVIVPLIKEEDFAINVDLPIIIIKIAKNKNMI